MGMGIIDNNMIQFEDFQKLDLRVAKIIEVYRVEGSDKLLRLQIDLGEEKRQLVSGIAKFYNPEQLIGKEIIIIANLEPRMIFGMESQGMLLAAGETEAILLQPDKEVTPGTKVH